MPITLNQMRGRWQQPLSKLNKFFFLYNFRSNPGYFVLPMLYPTKNKKAPQLLERLIVTK